MSIVISKKNFTSSYWNSYLFTFFTDTFIKSVEKNLVIKSRGKDPEGNEMIKVFWIWFYKEVKKGYVINALNPYVFILVFIQRCLILCAFAYLIYSMFNNEIQYFGFITWVILLVFLVTPIYESWIERKLTKLKQFRGEVSWVLEFLKYCLSTNDGIEFLKELIISDKLDAESVKSLPNECTPSIFRRKEVILDKLNHYHWKEVEANLRAKYDLTTKI